MTPSPAPHLARAAAAALASLLLLAAPAAGAAVAFTVNDLGDAADAAADGLCDTDAGPATTCTLRAALQELNADAAGGTIGFDAALEGATISVGATALPTVTKPLLLEGPGTQGVGIIRTLAAASATGQVLLLHPGAGKQVTLRRLLIGGGWTYDLGGGVRATSGSLTLEDVRVVANRSFVGGAGIYLQGSGNALTLTRVLVSGNDALTGAETTADGGGIRVDGWADTVVTIDRSSIQGNVVTRQGGGLFVMAGQVVIRNSTFTENRTHLTRGTSQGGAIFSWPQGGPATLSLEHVTISGNSAAVTGGLTVIGADVTTLTVVNSVLAGNAATYGSPDCFHAVNTVLDANHAFVGVGEATCAIPDGVSGNRVGTVAAPLQPVLVESGSRGTAAFGLAPGLLSPLRDAGDQAVCSLSAVATDQQGTSRNPGLDGDRDGTPACDLGAIEAPAPSDPAITLFEASPLTVEAGGVTSLNWLSTDATGCTLSDGSGAAPEPVAAIGGRTVSNLLQTTTWTLTCAGVGAAAPAAVAQATVTVTAAPAVDITAFTASPATVDPGGSSSLTWTVANATACTIAAGAGAPVPAFDYHMAQDIQQTTTFTLHCTGLGGEDSAQVTVTVAVAPGDVVIESFTADPAVVAPGGSTTLQWLTRDATGCGLSAQPCHWRVTTDSIGREEMTCADSGTPTLLTTGTAGTLTVTPATSSHYSLTCAGQPTPATADLLVDVAVAEIVRLDAVESQTANGGPALEFLWDARWVTSCRLTINGAAAGGAGTSGQLLYVVSLGTYTYQLECTGDYGSVSQGPFTVEIAEGTTKGKGGGLFCATAASGGGSPWSLLPFAVTALWIRSRRRRPVAPPAT